MSIAIPIISEFVDKGIKQARQEFKQLETTGQKAQFALKKAAVPATAALAGLAAGLADAAKAAIEDAQSQTMLAKQLKTTTGATDAQIASLEDWISAQGKAYGVADDQLRPALAQLTRASGDVSRAQKLASVAMDISASTGKDLAAVTNAMTKAELGQFASLRKLGVPIGENTQALMDMASESRKVVKAQQELDAALAGGDKKEIAKATEKLTEAQARYNSVAVEGADFADDLAKVFGGAASEAANTAAGQMQRLTLALDETKEGIGAALLPVLERLMPVLLRFSDWAQRNPTLLTAIIAAMGVLAAAIVAVNVAMALNPAVLITAAIVALGAAVVVAYQRFEGFRNVVKAVMGGVLTYFEIVANAWIKTANLIIRGMNLLKPGRDIGFIPQVNFRGDAETVARGAGVPMMANGGIVTGPTFALIGERSPEAVVPLDRLGSMGGGVTINVNGGDPQAVVDALQRWYRQNGPLPVKVA